ncbi:hypothetical protein BRC89_03585 [Halobacteriales archaeon QS_4_70_19]|jgi:hypothetical protein|nr:MAG: hypothetical protein BRC89_03585 [Halobacteriales archaeon QS_4_70_19]
MSSHTAADATAGGDGRAVVLVRNGSPEPRDATIVVDGARTVTRHADLAPGEAGVVAAPAAGHVTVAVYTAAASASFSFDPETVSAPPLFALREGRVLVSPG